jgi:hypothetical protein
MDLDQKNMDETIRSALIDFFVESPIAHGEIFDDGRRWCTFCQSPRFTCEPISEDFWADKMCWACQSLWPEYIEMVVNGMITDDDFSDTIPTILLN